MSETKELHARIENPAKLLPGATKAIQDLMAAAHSGGVDPEVLELVHMRASQINGCSFCVDAGFKSGEERHVRREAGCDSSVGRVALLQPGRTGGYGSGRGGHPVE